MIDALLWLLTFAGVVALIVFAWRSAMRRRGIRLAELLREEGVLRTGIDIPVRISRGGRQAHLLRKRGSIVLTERRLAGFAHRSRFVLLRGKKVGRGVLRAEGDWLVVRPAGDAAGGPEVSYRLGAEAGDWARDATRVLRGRRQEPGR